MTEQQTIFLGKIWQSKNFSLIFQIKDRNDKKKKYLIIDTKSKLRPFFITNEKPSGIIPDGNIARLLKKHLESKIITSFQKNEETDEFWITLKVRNPSEPPSYFIRFQTKPSLECSLISQDRKVYFRYSSQGIYTHIKSFEETFPQGEKLFKSFYPDEKISSQKTEDSEKQPSSSPNSELRKKLKRKLKTLKSSFEKTKSSFTSQKDLEEERTKISQLQNFLYLVKPGNEIFILKKEDSELENDLSFKLNPDLSPGKNLSLLFKNLQKKEKGLSFNEKRLKDLESEITQLESDLENLEKEDISDNESEGFFKKYKIKIQAAAGKKKETHESLPYKVFKDDKGVQYFVGKTSSDNDKLVKKSKSNDLWFHVSGQRGSHVIVPKQFIRKNHSLEEIKRTAGVLALYYSKAKNDERGEVYSSKRHLIKKDKKAAPGLWTVIQADTIFISYDSHELKKVLNFMIS